MRKGHFGIEAVNEKVEGGGGRTGLGYYKAKIMKLRYLRIQIIRKLKKT